MIYASISIDDLDNIISVSQTTASDALALVGNSFLIDYYENEQLFTNENYLNYYYNIDTKSVIKKS